MMLAARLNQSSAVSFYCFSSRFRLSGGLVTFKNCYSIYVYNCCYFIYDCYFYDYNYYIRLIFVAYYY